MNKISFIADSHIRQKTWKRVPRITGDAVYALDLAVAHCIATGSKALCHGGDLFHTKHPESTEVIHAVNSFNRLASAGIPVYAIQGQHDQTVPPWVTLGQVNHVNGKVFQPGGLFDVYGLDARLKDSLPLSYEDIPADCQVIMVHQLIKQAFDFEDKWDMDLDDLPPQVKLVIAGDYHERTDLYTEKGVHLVYPGSQYLSRGKEAAGGYILDIYDDMSVKAVELPGRYYEKLIISSPIELAQLIVRLKDWGQPRGPLTPDLLVVKVLDNVEGAFAALTDLNKAENYFMLLEPVAGDTWDSVLNNEGADEELGEDVVYDLIPGMAESTECAELVTQLLRNPEQCRAILDEWRVRKGVV